MAVFQCPVCELRFSFNNELEEHLAEAHPEFEAEYETVEDEMMAAAKRRQKEPGRKTDPKGP
jgi:hypothetical protein